MRDERDEMMEHYSTVGLGGAESTSRRRPRTALVLLVNLLNRFLPPSRFFRLRANLYSLAGYCVSRSCRIMSSARIWGDCSVVIGDHTFIGHEVLIAGGNSRIEIGNFVDIGPRAVIVSGTHAIDMEGPRSAGEGCSRDIIIEDGVWIGANSTVLGGVRLGRKCIVGAGSVVNRDISPYTIAAGVPCRPIKVWNPGKQLWEVAG
jgi:acetyltransferase-like isoleucine patch superfamily enzyme